LCPEERKISVMKKATVEKLLSYLDRLADYLDDHSTVEDSEQLRSTYEILLEAKLDRGLPPSRAAQLVIRKRIATALEKLREPSPGELEQIQEVEQKVRRISRLTVWKHLRKLVVALVPRGHGSGPAPLIKEKDYPAVINIIKRLETEHPEWKREAIYAEAGKEFGVGWRSVQSAYLAAKRLQTVGIKPPSM
jgi:hypothetical protein